MDNVWPIQPWLGQKLALISTFNEAPYNCLIPWKKFEDWAYTHIHADITTRTQTAVSQSEHNRHQDIWIRWSPLDSHYNFVVVEDSKQITTAAWCSIFSFQRSTECLWRIKNDLVEVNPGEQKQNKKISWYAFSNGRNFESSNINCIRPANYTIITTIVIVKG